MSLLFLLLMFSPFLGALGLIILEHSLDFESLIYVPPWHVLSTPRPTPHLFQEGH